MFLFCFLKIITGYFPRRSRVLQARDHTFKAVVPTTKSKNSVPTGQQDILSMSKLKTFKTYLGRSKSITCFSSPRAPRNRTASINKKNYYLSLRMQKKSSFFLNVMRNKFLFWNGLINMSCTSP